MTTLFTFGALASVIPPDQVTETLLPVVLTLTNDSVPNVRFNACKTLEQFILWLDHSTIQTSIKPVLYNMLEDTDKDVKYYATLALQACNKV